MPLFVAALVLGSDQFSIGAETSSSARDVTPHWTRALAESAGLVGFGIIWYYVDSKTNQKDWDFPFALKTFEEKLITLEAVRFENNNFYHNAFGHAVAGSLYYNTWRSNGFGALGSLAATLAISWLWEGVIEFREVLSINDMIVTPLGGFALGEAIHQASRILLAGGSALSRVVVGLIDPPLLLNHWIDGEPLDTNTSARLLFHAQYGASDFQKAEGTLVGLELGLEAQLRGSQAGWSWDAPLSSIEAGVRLSQEGRLLDLALAAEHVFLGYTQTLEDGPTLFGGLATGFRHSTHDALAKRDRFGVVELIGTRLSLFIERPSLSLALDAGTFVDFAIVKSFALDAYAHSNTLDGARSSLRDREYYYALGLTARASVSLSWYGLHVRGFVDYDHLDSIDGLDRFEESVTQKLHLLDRRILARGSISHVLVGELRAGVAFELRRYSGTIRSSSTETSNFDTETHLALQFELPVH